VDCLEERTLLSSYATFFQLDGDASSAYPAGATGHDWSQVYSDFTKSTTNASGTGAINFYNDPVPVTVPGVTTRPEDAFSGGNSKDINDISQWTYNSNAPQNKANLENAIAASYIDPNNSNHTYLYVGTDRYDNSGSTIIGVWFLQNPIAQSAGRFWVANPDGSPSSTPETHQNGDVLLVANFGGGGAVSITSFTWNNGGIPSTGTTLDSSKGVAVVNSTALDGASGHAPPVPWPYRSSASGTAANYVQSGEFFEAGVDLNNLFGTPGPFNFSSFVVETRASTSANSTLSDFIVGHVSTAPDVAVTKVADSPSVDAGSPVGFTVTVKNVGVGDLANVTLTDNSTSGLPTTSLPLPSGANNDIVWSIPADGNPSGKFVLTGSTAGNQYLSLVSNLALPFDAAPISVHIVGTGSTSGDGVLDNRATVGASNETAGFLSNNQADAQITIVNGGVTTITPQNSVEGAAKAFDMGSFLSANSGTASVDVDWGDGTTHTTFTFTNTPNVAYSMGTQSHTYTEEGPYTVTETVTLGSAKQGTFSVNVSDPDVAATATYPVSAPYTTTYNGNAIGTLNLATFTDPGGAEANDGTHYSATVAWGGSFPMTTGTITFASGTFTISASVPYTTVGTYSPIITINHESSKPQQVTDTVTINPAPLTITANSTGKTYGQTVTFLGTEFTTSTLYNSDTVTSVTLTSAGAAASATVAGSPYSIVSSAAQGTGLGNYAITYANGSLTVNARPLTITANSTSKTYGQTVTFAGTEFSVGATTTTPPAGLINGDSVTSVTLTGAGAAATATVAGSPYSIVPSAAVGSGLSNYSIQYVNGSLTVNARPLTITANSTSKTYGQTVTFAGTEFSVGATTTTPPAGLINGDSVTSVTLTGAGAAATATVAGSPYSIVPSAAQGSGLSNYNINYVNGSLVVSKAHLTVTALDDAIDEAIDPTGNLIGYSITGFVNSETLATSGVTGSPSLTTTATGTNPPGTYPITPAIGTLTASNYDFTTFTNGTLTMVDVAPTIVMSTGTIRLNPGDGFTRPGYFTDPGSAVPSESWTNNPNPPATVSTVDYGDGTVVALKNVGQSVLTPGSSPGFSIGHVYANVNQYTVTVTISDNYGASSVLQFTVNVAALPTLTLSHNGNPIGSTAQGQTNTPFALTGSFTESTATGGWVINWGDPAGDSQQNPNVQTGTVSSTSGTFNGSHTYKHKGTYTVSVTFTDAFGDSVTQSFALTIS
jgi:hypothetical protein